MPKVFPELLDSAGQRLDLRTLEDGTLVTASPPTLKGSILNQAIGANADFFDVALLPTNTPTTFRIYVVMDTAGVLNVMRNAGGAFTAAEELYEGANLAVNGAYEFNITVAPGENINLQYSVAATILTCIVVEVYA